MKRLTYFFIIFCGTLFARNIEFAGRTWYVQNGYYGPGPNHFSDNTDNVWVDANGYLHLKLRESGGTWYCPSIRTIEPTGYGMHRFYVRGTITNLDPNVIFSPFAYYDTSHEIDIEFARWGDSTPGIHNAQFVVQPHTTSGNLHTFKSSQITEDTTHYFDWSATNVHFKSFQGHHLEEQNSGELMQEWYYDGNDVPDQTNDLNIHIIIWLLDGDDPLDGNELELIVTDADYPCYESPPPSASDGTFSNFVKISWAFVDSADKYQVWRSLDTVASHAEKIADNITTNYYDDSSASNSVSYYYWILGENDFGVSRFKSADLGWRGGGTHVSTVDFFFDGFTRKNGNNLSQYKWDDSGWSSGGEILTVSNNSAYVFPGSGDWNWRVIRPLNTEAENCALNVNTGEGVVASIILNKMDISVTNSSSNDATVNISILDRIVNGNPYELSATGLLLYADYNVETDKIQFNLYRKTTANSVGTSLSSVERDFVSGAEFSLSFAKDNAKVIYNSETLFNGAHGVDTSSSQDRYAGFFVQNIGVARCAYFLDSAHISAFGDCFATAFDDNFSLGYLNNSKWFNSSGEAAIENDSCKLSPGNYNWATADLGMKIDAFNPLKLDPTEMPVYINVQISDVEVSAINSSGPELMFKTELYPERNHNSSWNYNFTNLSVSTSVNISGGTTSLNVTAQLFSEAETSQDLFSESVNYDPGANLQIRFDANNIAATYNGTLLNSAAHNIDVATVYEKGIFPMFIAQNYDSGRGAIYIDNANISLIPEPFIFVIYQLLFIIIYRKGCSFQRESRQSKL